jgi:hypothetical protein
LNHRLQLRCGLLPEHLPLPVQLAREGDAFRQRKIVVRSTPMRAATCSSPNPCNNSSTAFF